MGYLIPHEPKDQTLLQQQGISPPGFDTILDVVNRANDRFYQLSPRHKHFRKMLQTSDLLLKKESTFQKLPLKEQKEWLRIRDTKTGDRGYICRYLVTEMKRVVPDIVTDLIEPRFHLASREAQTDPLEMAPEIDALLLAVSVPRYFEYMDRMTDHKKSVFNTLQRAYSNFILIRALNIVTSFLREFEHDLPLMKKVLFDNGNIQLWPMMTEIIDDLCQQTDPGHHDALSTYAVNCLRSIYVSMFNVAMALFRTGEAVSMELRRFLPLIPDQLDFSRQTLEADGAWNRYQDHQFLFMRLPQDQRQALAESLSRLTAAQRVVWMGSLGQSEIRWLILQIVSQQNQFVNLANACLEIPESDEDARYLSSRVWDILKAIYMERLRDQPGTPPEIHNLFTHDLRAGAADSRQAPVQQEADADRQLTDPDLSLIRTLSFLVVDDSSRMRQMTIKVLKETGVQHILEAENGLEAWNILEEQSVDVILCDWIMPEMSGIDLVQKVMQIESIARTTTFIMLTTVNNKSAIVEALSVGVRGYLIKPFTRKQLLEKVFFATEWLRKEQSTTEP